jgi:dTDP-4-dehydrorhamnose 3,5-epimerase
LTYAADRNNVPDGMKFYATDIAEVQYKVTDYYYPEYDRTLIWDDVDLKIEWGVCGNPILSQKDSKGKTFQECEKYV